MEKVEKPVRLQSIGINRSGCFYCDDFCALFPRLSLSFPGLVRFASPYINYAVNSAEWTIAIFISSLRTICFKYVSFRFIFFDRYITDIIRHGSAHCFTVDSTIDEWTMWNWNLFCARSIGRSKSWNYRCLGSWALFIPAKLVFQLGAFYPIEQPDNYVNRLVIYLGVG